MNLWECDRPGCTSRAVGVGGAVGLTAVGWYFRPGPVLFCPAHRPDGIPGKYHDCGHDPCPTCRAYEVAGPIQAALSGDPDHIKEETPRVVRGRGST